MNWWQRFRCSDRLERELDAEIQFHVDQQAEANVERGMSEENARHLAHARFGGFDQIKEECRDARGTRWAEETIQDLRFAVRLLLKDRRFTFAAVLTLALGIGANTAMFSVIDSVLFTSLPYRNPERLVWITENNVTSNNSLPTVSGGDLEQWRNRAISFDGLSVLLAGDATMDGDEPARVRVACLSEPLERLFGVAPTLGRDFLPQEFAHAPQAPGLRPSTENRSDTGVTILSDRLFRKLGGTPEILGTSVVIGNLPYTVVGVLPTSFRLPVTPSLQLGIGAQTDVDLVLNTTMNRTSRGPGAALARLKPGVQIETAIAELEGIRNAANEARGKDENSSSLNLEVMSLHDHVVGGTKQVLLVLWASVVFVLLVACVNITSLLLARAVDRQQETAVRSALGAGRWRLARQMLAENMVLAVAGGLSGVALGYGVVEILTRTTAIDVPRLQDATLNAEVLAFSAVICAMTGVVLSVIPTVSSRANLGDVLKGSARTMTSSGSVRRWHGALVIGELALALIPITGAGLMLQSLWQVRSEGAVMAPRQVITARIQSSGSQSPRTPADRLRESDRLIGSIEALPGVAAAAVWGVTFGYPVRIAGVPPPDEQSVAMWFNVSPHYREASGVRLVAGRWFTEQDRTATPAVVVISERFARRFTTEVSSIDSIVGRTTFGPFAPPSSRERDAPMTIIGVVSDFRSGRLGILQPDDARALPQVFFPDVLRPMSGSELLVRAGSNPMALVGAMDLIRIGGRVSYVDRRSFSTSNTGQ